MFAQGRHLTLQEWIGRLPAGKHYVSAAVLPDGKPETLALLLAPFAPHLAEELWEILGHAESVFQHPWPTADGALAQADVVEVVLDGVDQLPRVLELEQRPEPPPKGRSSTFRCLSRV